jgi:hypothetical protein
MKLFGRIASSFNRFKCIEIVYENERRAIVNSKLKQCLASIEKSDARIFLDCIIFETCSNLFENSDAMICIDCIIF